MKRMWEKLRRRIQSDKTRRDTAYVEKILDDESRHRLPSLTLAQYVGSIVEVPLPTAQQRENFVEYVSHANSWYEQLGIRSTSSSISMREWTA